MSLRRKTLVLFALWILFVPLTAWGQWQAGLARQRIPIRSPRNFALANSLWACY